MSDDAGRAIPAEQVDGAAPSSHDLCRSSTASGIRGERLEQPVEIAARVVVGVEALGELDEHGGEAAGARPSDRCRARNRSKSSRDRSQSETPSRAEVHVRVRELLVELHGEQKPGRRARHPGLAHRRFRHPVERRVHLDGVEALGVVRELVEAARPPRRIEDPVPRAAPARDSSSRMSRCGCLSQSIEPVLTICEIYLSIQGESTHVGRPWSSSGWRPAICAAPGATRRTRSPAAGRCRSTTCSPKSIGTDAAPSRSPAASRCSRPASYPLMEQLLARGYDVLLETGGHRARSTTCPTRSSRSST